MVKEWLSKAWPKERGELNIDIDDLLDNKIGYGPWQRFSYIMLLLPSFVAGLLVVNSVFVLHIPEEFECVHKSCLVRHTDGKVDYRYIKDAKEYDANCYTNTCGNLQVRLRCNSSKSEFHYRKFKSYIMKNSLIIDKIALCESPSPKILPFIANSFLFFGFFIGGIVFGAISDTFGRRKALGSAIFTAMFGTGIGALISNVWGYVFTKIFCGAAVIGCFTEAYILGVEIVGKKNTVPYIPWHVTVFSFFGHIITVPYALGEATNSFLAYNIMEWKGFQFCVSFICGIAMISFFMLPESPRWMIETGKKRRVEDLLIYAGRVNGYEVNIQEDLNIDQLDEEHEDPLNRVPDLHDLKEIATEVQEAYSGRNGLFHPEIKNISIILFITWCSVSITYYGSSIALESMHLIKDLRLEVAVIALVEIPGYILSGLFIDVIGRKPILVLSLAITGVLSLVAIFFRSYLMGPYLKVCLLIAKMSIATTYNVIR